MFGYGDCCVSFGKSKVSKFQTNLCVLIVTCRHKELEQYHELDSWLNQITTLCMAIGITSAPISFGFFVGFLSKKKFILIGVIIVHFNHRDSEHILNIFLISRTLTSTKSIDLTIKNFKIFLLKLLNRLQFLPGLQI